MLQACISSKPTKQPAQILPSTPKAAAEFRAAWVATVANIDWPDTPGLSTAEQQAEATRILDFLKDHHFNAVIFQVRPQADALYKSDLEPWSYYLTGTQGKAPDPYYDPLEFWTKAAHDRGLELHVWLNPYRAHHKAGGEVTETSIVKKRPELVLFLKEGYWWFDPALKGTQDHSAAVVMDIVKRYDIDGVHFDDYFYPYPSYNNNEDFPDSASWKAYQASGGKLSRGDWRRDAVNTFIERVYKEIKAVKPHVKFGLSPFGIWRPGHPASTAGFDQYDQLYADAKLWLNKGWIDYFTPQLYWPINRIPQSFPVLLGWWSGENTQSRHLWPGMSVSRDTAMLSVRETLSQIMITRGMLPQSAGAVHWNFSAVIRNPALAEALLQGPYRNNALVPASPWLDHTAPSMPVAQAAQQGDHVRINWSHNDTNDVFRWVVHMQYDNTWTYKIYNRSDRTALIPIQEGQQRLRQVAVTAVDRTGNESAFKALQLNLTDVTIVPRSGWNAAPARPYKPHQLSYITIHHEGTRLAPTADAARKINAIQRWGMGPDRNWSDVPYHFLIAPDGTIYEGRDVHTAGETATEYDPSGHLLITCLGNLEVQEVDPRQLDALVRLVAYASRKYNIPVEKIASHRDHSRQTTCPGKNLYHYLQNGYIKKRVTELLAMPPAG